jgi:hypothetical protein
MQTSAPIWKVNMNTRNFWPLDFDPEEEIYENLAWDLPGYKPHREKQPQPRTANARIARQRNELR